MASEDDLDEEKVDVNGAQASFDAAAFDPYQQQYGLKWLTRVRNAMLPIAKPEAVSELKFLFCPDASGGPDAEPERDKDRIKGRDKAKGKGKDGKGQSKGVGRHIPEMGTTEILPGTAKGTWWRNISPDGMDVIIREQFLLSSPEVLRVQPGQYVLQAGPLEVFVSGPATGLQRMPAQPRGWATVDASSVGGPVYLEKVRSPHWKVVFSSGSSKGDIVVRHSVSLDSEEVAVLTCGTIVDQAGPLEMTKDGIVRMPIHFADGIGREPASASQPPRTRHGWVTCDASAQGGPKFFEPVAGAQDQQSLLPAAQEEEEQVQVNSSSWDQNRMWKVTNLEAGQQLAVVRKVEPYAPGSGRIPADDNLVKWLSNGDVVEQTGHSKKLRGYMVMPIRMDSDSGWVVRRMVDKSGAWFQEIVNGESRDRRKTRRDRD